jgi:cation:H+ antiporter
MRRMDWVWLVVSLVVILGGAELFTNGVEWVGEGFGLSEGAVGSVLAAIGTALPETLLPIVAIFTGRGGAGDDIGIGAILGAPFMLTTVAMFALGVTVLVMTRRGKRSDTLEHDPGVFVQDLRYFLVMYALALIAGMLDVKAVDVALAVGLLVAYGFYVRRHFASPGAGAQEVEAAGVVKPLHLRRLLRGEGTRLPHSIGQTVAGLGVIVAGAQVFVHALEGLANRMSVSPLVFALLVAPIATELPEALNASVIWARRGRDVLALGNITGAMVFQATFPVSIGLVFTPWRLNQTAGVAGGIALVAGTVLYLSARLGGRLRARLLLLQGVLYVGYVAYVIARG